MQTGGEADEFGATRRRCTECGADLAPEIIPTGDGLPVAYLCAVHGLSYVIGNPFESS